MIWDFLRAALHIERIVFDLGLWNTNTQWIAEGGNREIPADNEELPLSLFVWMEQIQWLTFSITDSQHNRSPPTPS